MSRHSPTPSAPSACDLVRELAQGRVSSIDLVEQFIKRIATLDASKVNAVVVHDFDRARMRAHRIDEARKAGLDVGPLQGLPITVKEEMAVDGLPLTKGVLAHRTSISSESCDAVSRLLDAGAIIIGKTNVPAHCLDWQAYNPVYGETLNPHDARATPGGSSGGSAAALAANLCALELGGDVAGSIRIPANFCGVVGLAPTPGRVPTGRNERSMAVFGPMGRTVRDVALAFAVLADPCPSRKAATSDAMAPITPLEAADVRTIRITVWRQEAASPHAPDADVLSAIDSAVHALQAAGAYVDEHARPASVDLSSSHDLYTRMLSHAARNGSAEAWDRLVAERNEVCAQWDRFFVQERIDCVLAPVTVSAAFAAQPEEGADAYTAGRTFEAVPTSPPSSASSGRRPYGAHFFWAHMAIIAKLPALALPTGSTKNALPLGVQLIGRSGMDERVLAVGAALEAALEAHGTTTPGPMPQCPPPAIDR
mmetsp:Transcript_11203/g.29190  ORF Transcript_11203/g.29190 Transcript_11203/m.29190 type:complete len:482 (+) Transcript_11203:18-1463(+)